jgi:hypothetical protein
MKFWKTRALLTVALGLALAAGAVAQQRAEMINGNHWTKWSQENKLVYVRGLTNWADFINEAGAQRGKTMEYCMSNVLVGELRNKTLGQIVSDVDAYYKDNPGKMNNTVVEAILRHSTTVCNPAPGAKEKKK